MKVLITGITGFIGSAIAKELGAKGWVVVGQSHSKDCSTFPTTRVPITSKSDWSNLLTETDLVIHCAAYNPKQYEKANLIDYLETNSFGSIELAKQAAMSGVKRFIFISSVKVNGETTLDGVPFNQQSAVTPQNDYALSKSRAEEALFATTELGDMDIVVVRAPLVYGPGVDSNFTAIMRLVHKRTPLPFGSVSNKRSFVFIDNLVDLIVTLTTHANVSRKIFFVSDDHDVSTSELLRTIGLAMNRKSMLLPVPTSLLIGLCRLIGRNNISDKLLRSLQVDITSTKVDLGWHPPVTFEQGIAVTVSEYLAREEQDR